MNTGGHVTLAVRKQPNLPGYWLGSALPDLAAIGRFRLLGCSETSAITEGIAFHHATDEAFHRNPWFVEKQRSLHRALTDEGVERGPARAVAHVGPELLLDGRLLDDRTGLNAALDLIPVLVDDLVNLVEPQHRGGWREHLGHITERGLPTDYHDPDAVAARLFRILRGRRRLAFSAEQIDLVARQLHGVKPEIDHTAQKLVDDLARELIGS